MVVYILQNTRASSSEAVDGAKNVFTSGVSMLGEGPSLDEEVKGVGDINIIFAALKLQMVAVLLNAIVLGSSYLNFLFLAKH
jgi:hypothetical protein